MPSRLTFALALAFAAISAACGETAITEITGPTGARCETDLDSVPTSVSSNGGQISAQVDAARDCTWTAASEASWIRVSPTTGQGEASLTITVDQNSAATTRNGTIVLNDSRTTIAQEPAPCRFQLSEPGIRMPQEGGSGSVRITTLDGCGWQASSPESWARVLNSSGRGSATVNIDVEPNGGGERRADLILAGQRFALVQDGGPAAPPPSPPTPSPPPEPNPPPENPPPEPPAPNPPPEPPEPGPIPPLPPLPPLPPVPPTPPPEEPTPIGEFRERGEVSGLSGSCPSIQFQLAGRTVIADEDTRFRRRRCESVGNGARVDVRGQLMSDDTVRAEEIEIERKNGDDDDEH